MVSIDKILFPTDFSTCAGSAFGWALELARSFQAELHVFHGLVLGSVLDDDAAAELDGVEQLARGLDAVAADRLGSLGAGTVVPVKRVTRRGLSAATLIRDYSDEEDIDLTVMGTHGRRTAAHVLLGSVTEEVVRTSANPVLTIRERERGRPLRDIENILVALDLSENSRWALPYAKALAAEYHATLQLLHVVEPATYPSFYAVKTSDVRSLLGNVEQQAHAELARFVNEAEGAQVPFATHVAEGQAVSAIVDFAKNQRSDVIVVTTHGLTGLKRFLLGSVAEKVVRRAASPVLTVQVPANASVSKPR